MMRAIIGPVANAILRQIGILARIDGTDRQKPILVIEAIRSVDWASLTFVGQRHEFDLRLEGEAGAVADAMAVLESMLGESEIPLGRAFVAEIRVVAGTCEPTTMAESAGRVSQQLHIEALSIQD